MKAKNSPGKEYAKWSSLALQGVGAIVILLLVGKYVDDKMALSKPIFTIAGILLGVFYFFYSLFRAVNSK